jgi:hypothetical protein
MLGALILSGCWNGRVLYSFEEPSWVSVGGGLRTELSLVRDALTAGYFPRVSIASADKDPSEALAKELASKKFRAVVVGPLLSLQWRDYALRFPDVRFVLIGGSARADLPPNAVVVRYDRTNALKTAGYAAGLSVRDEEGGASQSADGHRIAVLTGPGSELSAAETDAFGAGVAEALAGGEPIVRTIDNPADKNVVKSTLESLRGDGVEIFLLGLGASDPWCLEVLSSAGGCAVVEGWAVSAVFPQQVFLSVEDDIVGGIRLALGARNGGGHEVDGPVRIVVGKARGIPDAARTRIRGG